MEIITLSHLYHLCCLIIWCFVGDMFCFVLNSHSVAQASLEFSLPVRQHLEQLELQMCDAEHNSYYFF